MQCFIKHILKKQNMQTNSFSELIHVLSVTSLTCGGRTRQRSVLRSHWLTVQTSHSLIGRHGKVMTPLRKRRAGSLGCVNVGREAAANLSSCGRFYSRVKCSVIGSRVFSSVQRRSVMTSSSKRREELHAVNGGLKQSTWSKAVRCKAVWDEKDEFLDVVYWFRQIIAVILGVIWGVAPLKGFLGIAIFCVINAGVLYVYFSSFQQVDEEEYGGTWELTKEGFMTSFALFLVDTFWLRAV
uniref:RAB5 interacting factor n=1 Tax=Cyprinus carpio TaxID=7962 RepID=A0A8C1LVE2_CYPCA